MFSIPVRSGQRQRR